MLDSAVLFNNKNKKLSKTKAIESSGIIQTNLVFITLKVVLLPPDGFIYFKPTAKFVPDIDSYRFARCYSVFTFTDTTNLLK